MVASPSKLIAFLLSTNIDRTVSFYTSTLSSAGFLLGGRYNHEPELGEEDTFCSIAAGEKCCVNMYFRTGLPSGAGKVMVMLDSLEEIDELWTSVSAAEVEVVDEIEDKPWGYRQFEIADPDKNQIQFFAFLSDEE